jgi:hypothetical protein
LIPIIEEPKAEYSVEREEILVNAYQSESFDQTQKETIFESIENTVGFGPTAKFDVEEIVEQHDYS